MATAAIRQQKQFSGLRPIEPSRDLGKVASLIQSAFADDLDRAGQSMLREMRTLSRLGPLLWWFDQASPAVNDLLSGFVWVEDGQVVGNVTVSQAAPASQRWVISNVAVAPEYRGRGIARMLMQAALDSIRAWQGRHVTLQVRDDNAVALHLYRSLGFREVFGTTYLRLDQVPGDIRPPTNALGMQLRRLSGGDAQQAYQLARLAIPEAVQVEQPIRATRYALSFETRLGDWFKALLGSGPTLRLVAVNQDRLEALLIAEPAAWRAEGHISLIVHPACRGLVERDLIARALSHLRKWSQRVAVARHPTYHPEAIEAFASFGFRKERTLLWMKCEL
jgi:ribosomal protein S18 acetylase RimI-like enzyme